MEVAKSGRYKRTAPEMLKCYSCLDKISDLRKWNAHCLLLVMNLVG
jgi:hypothetical protein